LDDGLVKLDDPPPGVPGMIRLRLDTEGRLCWFEATTPDFEESHGPEHAPDWTPLLAAAGLDMTRFQSADPQWIGANPFDARAAWTGSYAYAPEVPIRVEASSWRGRPVSFLIVPPWIKPGGDVRSSRTFGLSVQGAVELLLFVISMLLCWRNLSLGRSDLPGAARLAGFYFVLSMLSWVVRPQHASSLVIFARDLFGNIGASLFSAVLAGALYVGLEPHVRRRWPQSMVTWSRLLSGRIRDPLVGAHILIGIALGTALILVLRITSYLRSAGYLDFDVDALYLLDTSGIVDSVFYFIRNGVNYALGTFFLFFLVRVLLRREWLAAAVVLGLIEVASNGGDSSWQTRVVIAIALTGLIVIVIRFGFLAMAATLVLSFLANMLLTNNFSVWYANSTILGLVVILAVTAYAFHAAVANRQLFKPNFLAPD
jgi:hypothetical protein